MRYLLDSNVCIGYINGRSPEIRKQVDSKAYTDIVLSSITKGEMYFGSRKSQNPKRSRAKQDDFLRQFDSLPFDDDAAEEYADIRAYLETQGKPIGTRDMLIAAIARANGLVVVTHNIKEFSRIPGLNVEDWEAW